MKLFLKIIEWSTFLVLIIILLVAASSLLPSKNLLSSYVISSGSMEPTLATGSLIFTSHVDPENIKNGDVITFTQPTNNENIIVHRVVEKTGGEAFSFKTKGDNNKAVDEWTVMPEHIQGITVFSIPYVGFFIDWLKTPVGFAIGLGIPALFLLIFQVRKILQGINEEVEKRTNEAVTKHNGEKTKIAILVFFAMFTLLSTATPKAFALFTASAQLSGITLMVASEDSNSKVKLDFYKIGGKAVGFTLKKTSDIVKADYMITYKRDGGVNEGIEGTINNPSNKSKLESDKIILGTCSGNVCNYHKVEGKVYLTVVLTDKNGKQTTLNDELKFDQNNNSCGGVNIEISGNGAGSHNTVDYSSSCSTIINQSNQTTVVNQVNSNANTGGNSANNNSSSNTSVTSGSANSNVNITNQVEGQSAVVN